MLLQQRQCSDYKSMEKVQKDIPITSSTQMNLMLLQRLLLVKLFCFYQSNAVWDYSPREQSVSIYNNIYYDNTDTHLQIIIHVVNME